MKQQLGSDPDRAVVSTFQIDGRTVGPGSPTYVIAEIGSNHDGDLDTARAMIRAAAEAGADAVKFQSFTADGLTRRGEPAHPILERLTLPDDWHPALRDAAADVGLHFLSTPFDEERARLLRGVGVPAFKIASGDLTHAPLLRAVAAYARPLIVSTGMATLDEVRGAVEAIRAAGDPPLALLHCVSCYPARPEDMNLRAVVTLARSFGVPVGLSDHTPGHAMVLAAVALGATIVEKHVTFDRAREGPDHFYAMTFGELAAMVSDIRAVERALGDGVKAPIAREADGLRQGRRSVHAAVDIPAGASIEPTMLKVVRPASGVAPTSLEQLIGRRARIAIANDTALQWEQLE